jgi:hypothetical protein
MMTMRSRRRGRLGGVALAVLGASLGASCRSERVPEPESRNAAAASAQPGAFSFVLPADYVALELRGEGSERLRVPPGTRLGRAGDAFTLDAGPEFALQVEPSSPSLSELRGSLSGAKIVFEGEDLLIVEQGGGHAFVVVRELVPEWDESDRRRLSCSSAGFKAGSGKSPRPFDRTAIDRMVAACQSLELPTLE